VVGGAMVGHVVEVEAVDGGPDVGGEEVGDHRASQFGYEGGNC
jgi:hypothetical protein